MVGGLPSPDEAAYTKRNVAKALSGLVASGVVREALEGRTAVYELADAGGFAESVRSRCRHQDQSWSVASPQHG